MISLERKLFKIETILKLAESWSKDQENGLTDSSICVSAMKDIKRVIEDESYS